jgi:DNA topoisomerase I
MGRSLVIVESPAKAKTINKYLGNDYIVKSSIGHVRDLPTGANNKQPVDAKKRARQAAATRKMSPKKKLEHKSRRAKEQLITRMGIDPEHGWEANYKILPGKEKVVSELQKLAEKADTVYLATDLDREGEAIAWHLKETIGGDDERFKRVVFNEITKKAIQEAFSKPGELDTNRVNAQQARRFLDRVVGFMVSPLLWEKVARGLSAGRVQSVAVKLVVERERDIRAFQPVEYWTLHADLENDSENQARFEVRTVDGKTYRPDNGADSEKAVAQLNGETYIVSQREATPAETKPPKPFITSTLQQASSTRLSYGVKKTMMLAQRLYEAGYITYMRTDSLNISTEALNDCRSLVTARYGANYLPDKPNIYSSKAGAQEAHEAIRPSNVDISVADLQGVEDDAKRLYEMIWQQFVAGQMLPARFNTTTVKVEAGAYELRVRGRVMVFDGFLRAIPALRNQEDVELPEYEVGEQLKLLQLVPLQHFTKPPPRFSEAALVKELEKRGIGRPSTYANIISTIQDRGYVRMDKKRFYAEKIGEIVTSRLDENFTDLMDYGFTASMEEQLDLIAEGELGWKDILDQFYSNFSERLNKAKGEENGMRLNDATETSITCDQCDRPMMIRTGSTGVFLGCSGYNLPPKERCKGTKNLTPGDEAINVEEDAEGESRLLLAKHHCKVCETAMDSYLIDEQRKLHICGRNPDCSGFEVEEGSFKLRGYEGPVIECDKCGANMELKSGRFGKYFGCSSVACKNTRKLLRSGQPAPPKMDPVDMPELACEKVEDHYILRDGAAGLFLAASQFPKHRETRAPLVSELLPHKDEIDPKYNFLMSAPVVDPDGNKAMVRYARKTAEQYVRTEVEGKATGWKAFYKDDRWQVEDKRK